MDPKIDNLSQNDRNIIAEHALNTTLDHLREPLRITEQSHKPTCLSTDSDASRFDCEAHKAISKLLVALMGHNAAYHLRSKNGTESLAAELSTLFRRVQTDNINYDHYRALSQLVIQKALDVRIWNAVFELIATIAQTTPPASLPVTFDSTPVTHSSASQQDSEQIQRLVEGRIFEEIKGCTYLDVNGFFTKYFEGKAWTERTRKIFEARQGRHVDGRWTDFPQTPIQDEVCKWWFDFQNEFLSGERGVYYSSTTKDLTGCESKRQIDLFTKPNDEKLSKVVHDWKDIEVIGELTVTDSKKKAKLLQIARYVRDVFSVQPTRRYVHAFTLCGNYMQAWVFDRSGPYSSTEFDIHKEPETFIRMIAAYVMMSEEELGLDTFTERNEGGQFITVKEEATGKEKRLQLEQFPIAYQRATVCRGTSCFRTKTPNSKDFQYVTKFSWVSDKRRPEADLLRLAHERGVEGIAKLYAHHRITSIADMRRDLKFGKPYTFRDTVLSPVSSLSQGRSLLSQSFGKLGGLGPAEKASKKRKAIDAVGSISKKSRSNSQSPKKAKWKHEVNRQTTSLYTHDDSSFDNRIFRCLVISPAGRALRNYRSIRELLEALRDAIKAHKSLYTKGKILHRDISENNIIITNPEKTGGFTGILIDEDLAKEIGSGPSGARHQTGTMEFMAIQVLHGVDHTYRHDLESFFYVLLWICARRAWEREFRCKMVDRPERQIMTKWYTGTFHDIADAKEGSMHVNKFEDILEEFPEAFNPVKPLCKTIRAILFPYKDGLIVGTPPGPPDKLYNAIIEAFNNTLVSNDSK